MSLFCNGILEIRNHRRPTYMKDLSRALQSLREAKLHGHPVLDVHQCQGEDRVDVPCFAYSTAMVKAGTVKSEPYGVSRWFCVHVVLEGGWDDDVMGTYEIENDVQFCLCGVCRDIHGGTEEARRIDR